MPHPGLSTQALSLVGAFLCLIAYVAHQLQLMDPRRLLYNLMNAIGSGILAYIAFRPFQAGFWIMETIWTLVSIYTLKKALFSNRKRK